MRRRLAALLLIVCAYPAQASAEELTDLPTGALATNGPVTMLSRLGDTVYVRGDFTQIGTYSGSGLALDPATGARDPRYPTFNGQVSDVLSDGEGGWFVGGDFRQVDGGAHKHLAHVNADGTLDAAFRPKVDGFVDSLATDGTTLFIGGYFDEVGGKKRPSVAAVNSTTGALVSGFNARLSGETTELAYVPATAGRGARLFVGLEGLHALDPATGAKIPEFTGEVSTGVGSLAVIGERLYVGGRDLEALDLTTGAEDTGFAPDQITLRGGSSAGIFNILLPDGDRLLAGGGLTALGGELSGLVALDPDTGRVDPAFKAQIKGDVYDLARFGETLWAGGRFSSAEGEPATNLVALNATTGARDLAIAPRLDGPVYALATGERLFAGGEIALAGYSTRRGYAALQASTGALHPEIGADAHFGFSPYADYAASSGRLFGASQNFTQDDTGLFRSRIRVFDVDTGQRAAKPEIPRARGLNGFAVDEDSLFIAERLDNDMFPANRILVRSARSGKLLRRYHLPLKGYITGLEPHGDHLFVAGSFKRTRPSGQKANIAVLKVNLRSGELVGGFDPHVNGPVYDLTSGGRKLVISGIFSVVGPENDELRRPGFAAVDAGSGQADDRFEPHVYGGHYRRVQLLRGTLFSSSYSFSSGTFFNADTGARVGIDELSRAPVWASERVGDRLFVALNPVSPAEFYDHTDVHVVMRVPAPH